MFPNKHAAQIELEMQLRKISSSEQAEYSALIADFLSDAESVKNGVLVALTVAQTKCPELKSTLDNFWHSFEIKDDIDFMSADFKNTLDELKELAKKVRE